MNFASGAAENNNRDKRERMDHPRHRRLRSGADICCSSGDCTSRGQTPEKRGYYVRHSLRDQLNVWVVLASPLILSDTTADISDSIAPSIAIVMAGEIKGSIKSTRRVGNPHHRQQTRGNSTKSGSERFHRQFGISPDTSSGANEESDDIAGTFAT